ncbi:MAG: hypothetical protein ACERLG_01745 [Sedimentibacter sp.]
MSFLNIRGKMIHCLNCDNLVTIEYVGGNVQTQIGDASVMQQRELNEEFMPADYDFKNEGYYYHDGAICKDCIKDIQQNDDNYLLVDSDYIVFHYLEAVHNIMDHISRLPYSLYSEYLNNLTENTLKQINEELFAEIINTKTFGLKKEKKRLSQMFVEKSKEEINKSYKDFIKNSNEYKQLKKEGRVLSEKYEEKVIENLDFEGPIYRKINYMDTNNLNPYIVAETTVRVPLEVIGNTEFYEEAVEINKKSVLALFKNKSKFTLNNHEARKSIDYKYKGLNKKIVNEMFKMSFWK